MRAMGRIHDLGQKASLANERRKNGRAKPWKLKYLGIGNETWGCGGNMRAEYAADDQCAAMPPSSTRRATMGMIKVASGPPAHDRQITDFAEDDDEGRRPAATALSLHYYTVPRDLSGDKGPGHRALTKANGPRPWRKTLQIDEIDLQDCTRSWTNTIPRSRSGSMSMNGAPGTTRSRAAIPAFSISRTRCAMREVAALNLNIFHRHTDRVKWRQHRPDDQCAAGDDPDRQGEDDPDADLSCLRHVPALHGRDALSGHRVRAGLCPRRHRLPMVDVSAARGKDGKL